MATPLVGVEGHGQPPCKGDRLRPRPSAGAAACKRRLCRPWLGRKGLPLGKAIVGRKGPLPPAQ
ncbi:hypothetical protein BHM03_00062915, partial [Ensete ventricosum]